MAPTDDAPVAIRARTVKRNTSCQRRSVGDKFSMAAEHQKTVSVIGVDRLKIAVVVSGIPL